MKIDKRYFLITILFLSILIKVAAQQLPLIVTRQIDSLFKEFDNDHTPGCAIGVIRNDSLIYAKGYGMANLEYGIPITPETIFTLASVSKQFTGYSIVLLAKEGKLNLDDDVRTFLPWLPDFKRKIIVRHLLNHTSGLRDDLEMSLYGGLGPARIISQELSINYIKNSKHLNFEPGQKYSYSNSNYVLLAEIVKVAGGKSFREFTDSALFKPLGMTNSFFLDNPNKLIRNRAASYNKNGNQYTNAFHNVYRLGPSGMFSNIHDMAKWVMNFYIPKIGNANDIMNFTQPGKLTNGLEISYASGVFVNEYKGLKQYTHDGAIAGYRTNIAVFPDVNMAFVILSNVGSINVTEKTNELADIFLKNYTSKKVSAIPAVTESKNTLVDSFTAKSLSGNYISDDGLRFTFTFKEQKLIWENARGPRFLIQSGKGVFEEPNLQVKFVFNPSGKDTTIHQFLRGYDRILLKYTPDSTFINKHSEKYTGVYYSPELESRFNIIFKDGQLMLSSIKIGDIRLMVLDRNNMIAQLTTVFESHLKFFYNGKQKITGFEMNSPRMMHVRFDKIN